MLLKIFKGEDIMQKNFATTSVRGKITVTAHAILRFKQRQDRMDMSNKDVIAKIINQVRHSKLINISGTKEFRSHNGYIYLIEREYCKNVFGMLDENVTVVTMMMSKLRIKENYSTDFSLDTVDSKNITGLPDR